MKDISQKDARILFLLCAAIYLIFRLVGWSNTVLLDDHDSLFYLKSTIAYKTFDLGIINFLSSYSTPLYPFLSAVISSFGVSVENSARFCSLLMSIVLFLSFIGISKRVTGNLATALGLFILAVSPSLVPNSYAVLAEPSHIATVYLGLLMFLYQLDKGGVTGPILLGIIFGLDFLNRTEAIFFIVTMPFLQAFYLWVKEASFPYKKFLVWSGLFVFVFSVFAGSQIWNVSEKLGAPALNGRMAWHLLENSDIADVDFDRHYGLHFRKDETNLSFARNNYPEAKELLKDRQKSASISFYVERVLKNLRRMEQLIVRNQLGKIASVLALIGIIGLFFSERKIEAMLIAGFSLSNLIGPLLHSDFVYPRHVLIVLPGLILFQAVGAVYIARFIVGKLRVRYLKEYMVSVVLVVSSLMFAIKPLYATLMHPPEENRSYGAEEIKKPVRVLLDLKKNELDRKPIVVASKHYLAYFSGSTRLYMPYTDYDGLVEYLHLNNADVLYLTYTQLKRYPFMERFRVGEDLEEFTLLYDGADSKGNKIQLYRFINGAS